MVLSFLCNLLICVTAPSFIRYTLSVLCCICSLKSIEMLCSKTRYILSPLSACKDIFNTFTLNIICPYGNAAYRFELSVSPGDESAQKMPAVAEPSALKGGE